jgi:hypothetical protein
LAVVGAVGGALLGVDSIDGAADPLPVGPLGCVVGLGTERAVRVGDLVGLPVLLDLDGGQAPGPPAPGRRRHGPERLQDMAGPVSFDGQAGGPPLPGQGPRHLPILGAEVGVSLQPTVAALLVLAKLSLAVVDPIDLLGGHRQPTRHLGRLVVAAPQPAKHARGLRIGGWLVGGQGFLRVPAVGGSPFQLPTAVAGGLIQLAAQPVPLGPQLRRGQPLEIQTAGGVDGQGLPTGPRQGLGQLQVAVGLLPIGRSSSPPPRGSGPTTAYRRVSWRARDSCT